MESDSGEDHAQVRKSSKCTSVVIELKYLKYTIDRYYLAKSAFFERALQEGRWKEFEDGSIKLHDDDPFTLARCLQFLVCDGYEYGRYDHVTRGKKYFGSWKTRLSHFVGHDPILYFEYISTESEDNSLNEETSDMELSNDSADHKRRKDHLQQRKLARLYAPQTERESDAARDEERSRQCIDLKMYQIADKYCIPSLQDCALRKFQQNMKPIHNKRGRVTCAAICKAVNESYSDLTMVDDRVKKVVARYIAIDYKAMRIGTDAEAAEVEDWLENDVTLCFMVMDYLARVKEEEE